MFFTSCTRYRSDAINITAVQHGTERMVFDLHSEDQICSLRYLLLQISRYKSRKAVKGTKQAESVTAYTLVDELRS